MVEIRDRKKLKRWLDDRPREDGTLIAARATLRVLPAVWPYIERDRKRHRAALLLPMFRAISVARVAGTWPTRATEDLRAAYSAAADSAYSAYSAAAYSAASAAYSAYSAASSAAYSAASSAASSADSADAAADFADFAADAAAAVWNGISNDAATLASADHGDRLQGAALWAGETPKALRDLADLWQAMRAHLRRARGEDWRVWTDWYDDCLAGRPMDPDLELKKVLIPDEVWAQGPKALNAEVRRLIDEHEGKKRRKPREPRPEIPATEADPVPSDAPHIPTERPAAVRFTIHSGQLRLAPAPIGDEAPVGADDGQEVLVDLIDVMLSGSADRNSPILRALEMAKHALGEGAADFNPLRLGLVGILLEQLARRADEILLAEDAAQFQTIVVQQKLLVAQYQSWRDYAAAIVEPLADPRVEQDAANEAKAITGEMIDAHPEAFDPDARKALIEMSSLATPEATPDEENPLASEEARRGWLRIIGDALINFAKDAVSEGRKWVVKGIGIGGAAVLASVGARLTGLADMLPKEFGWLKTMVDWLASWLI